MQLAKLGVPCQKGVGGGLHNKDWGGICCQVYTESWWNVCGMGGGWWKVGRNGETTGRITSLETDFDRGRPQLCGYEKESQRIAELEMMLSQHIGYILGCSITQEFFPGVMLLGTV